MNFKLKKYACATLAALALISAPVFAEEAVPQVTIFKNVNIFDGTSTKLIKGKDVLIEGNLIKVIGVDLDVKGATVIDGGGRTITPGLHDMHTHVALFRNVTNSRNNLDMAYTGALAAARLEGMLMNGFTTVMDVGGPAKFAQKLVDEGIYKGPRIYPSEALITQTSGHGDFRNPNEVHPNLSGSSTHPWDSQFSCIADGETEIRRCVRQNLRRGATQVKIMAGGGVSSQFDPLHSKQSSPAETRAAVEAAESWGTFVAAHAYTDKAVKEAVENGVKYILHAPMISEDTAELMADKNVYMGATLAPVFSVPIESLKTMLSPTSFKKFLQVYETYPNAMRAAIKEGVTMVFGSDILSTPEKTIQMDDSANLEFLQLVKYMSNAEALISATGNANKLIGEMGPNNPYADGPTGVIKEGAYADLLLVDGDPIADIKVMTTPDETFDVIMKDGVIYKNEL
ncbi:amidohydrolase family protein [Thalassotalea psychrophila]|uniref:Amidohydrolase family protein n=1 Tax=Thalassotalea psychrophila TaxID=3065647 RepID=A0ABY9TXR5_9GAMM|nr:amidohydrolase family protein [Colwelliaceae bacterium SQ149]